MQYQPITCVWEVTMGCNMRCGHCGSSCTEPLPDELNTEEALDICGQIADLGVRWVTLSGGEPTTKKDLPQLVRRLTENRVAVNMITNGWLLSEQLISELKNSGVATIAISIDGTEEVHDRVRRNGAYERALRAFSLLRAAGIQSGAVTTITNQNIKILGEMKEELIRAGVQTWQVQIGLPMGNLKEKPDWVIEPKQLEEIINFCYETALEGRIKIYTADCIGYYTKKEQMIKRISYESDQVSVWDGCNAGIRGFGILQNGDILGCTSIRSAEFIEGNLRERSLRDIWEDRDSFKWRRSMKKEQLIGECRNCQYGDKCLGGCPNTKLTMNGDIYSDNQYCVYSLTLQEMKKRYKNETNLKDLGNIADLHIQAGNYQEAACILERLQEIEPDNKQAIKALGFCEYKCGNYELSKKYNEKVLQDDPDDFEALRGAAIAVFYQGDQVKGFSMMQKAVGLSGGKNMDILDDMRMMQSMMSWW